VVDVLVGIQGRGDGLQREIALIIPHGLLKLRCAAIDDQFRSGHE